MEKVALFSASDEKALLVAPWLTALALGLTATLSHSGSISLVNWAAVDMVIGIIFLDGMHIAYTFLMILFIPELRQWAKNVNPEVASDRPFAGFARSYWGQFFLVAIGATVAIYLMKFSELTERWPQLLVACGVLQALAAQWHTLAQTRGVSFCYHAAIRNAGHVGPPEVLTAMAAERRERRFFSGLLGGEITIVLANLLGIVEPQSSLVSEVVNWVGMAAIGIGAVGIIVNARTFPGQRDSNKLLFLSRLLIHPLRLYFGAIGMAIRVSHGTEYLFVLRQMVRNSKLDAGQKRRVLRATAWTSLAMVPIYVFTCGDVIFASGVSPVRYQLLFFATMIHIPLRFVHYYMDRLMYRMSNPVTRSVVAPLLVKRGSPFLPIPAHIEPMPEMQNTAQRAA